jgi:hypothetical protein
MMFSLPRPRQALNVAEHRFKEVRQRLAEKARRGGACPIGAYFRFFT